MPIIPFRQLGALGVNTDTDPFSLPDPRQWTTAQNARFRDGSVWRGPRFRKTGEVAGTAPQGVIGYGLPAGNGFEYLITFKDGRVVRWNQRGNTGGLGTSKELTPAYWTGHNYDEPGTWAETNAVVYFNRPDRALWYMRKGGKGFQKVEGWKKSWRCKSIRTMNGQVIAIGLQKDGKELPSAILNSDYTNYNTPAMIWEADTTNSASSNLLADLPGPLVDGWPMQDRMFLYGTHQTWVMEPTYDNFVYRYRRLFGANSGVISQNCVVDVSSNHFVFGPESIWTHNGLSNQDIVDGVVRRKIYDYLVPEEKHKFFVVYIQERNEVMFCYVSRDPDCHFKIPDDPNIPAPGCNRAAVLNLKDLKWSFDDLPFVLGAATVSANTGKRYEEFTPPETYDAMGAATYASFTDHTKPSPLFITSGMVPAPQNPPVALPNSFEITVTDSPAGLSAGDVTIPTITRWNAEEPREVQYDTALFLARVVAPASTGVRLVSIRPPYAMPLHFTEGDPAVGGYALAVSSEEDNGIVEVPFTVADDQGRTSDAVAWFTIAAPDYPPPIPGDHN
jgi:hypothetical protein